MKPRYKERIALSSVVTFRTGSQIGEGRLLDITSPGCLIESSVAVQKGQSLHLTIFLRGLESPLLILLGVVRWANGKQFGVEFIKMDEFNQVALDRYMAQHLAVSRHQLERKFSYERDNSKMAKSLISWSEPGI